MTSKIITYDLCKYDEDYEKLYKTIKSFPHWAHIAESVWFVKTELTCSELRNKLQSVIDKDDRIFVAKMSGEAAWHNTLCSNVYLKANL